MYMVSLSTYITHTLKQRFFVLIQKLKMEPSPKKRILKNRYKMDLKDDMKIELLYRGEKPV